MSTVSISEGLLYIADHPGRLYCLDAETGACYWMHDTKQQIWGSTLVADGKIYLGTQKALWVFAAGKEKHVLNQVRLGSPVWATPVVAGDTLYVASQRYLWAVEDLRRNRASALAATNGPPGCSGGHLSTSPGTQPGKRSL